MLIWSYIGFLLKTRAEFWQNNNIRTISIYTIKKEFRWKLEKLGFDAVHKSGYKQILESSQLLQFL